MIRFRQDSKPLGFLNIWAPPMFAAILVAYVFVVRSTCQVPQTSPTATTSSTNSNISIDQTKPISLSDALSLSMRQVSAFQAAEINARIATEDLRQARSAFFPKVTAPFSFTYTSPSLMNTRPREPSFISADAVAVYQALLNAEGEIDTSGKLRAILGKNLALVDAARAGSEVAKRDLEQSVIETYFGLALSTARRRGAESNLRSALEFEDNQKLQLEAGEIAPVDLVRARLQTAARRDELLQARTDETIATYALRSLIGFEPTRPISADDLLTQLPVPDEIERFSEATISARPELAQFAAQTRAAQFDVKAAKAGRWPQLIYSVSSGLISDSLAPGPAKNHSGLQAVIGLSVPIFDWGATRSRIAQARLREQLAENARQLAERQFVQAFYTAREQALAASERMALIRQSIADAENNLLASTSRYRSGEATIIEVIEAQNSLIMQRLALYQALFDYQIAKAKLARAAGK